MQKTAALSYREKPQGVFKHPSPPNGRGLKGKSEHARPDPTRPGPAPITFLNACMNAKLLKALKLMNRMSDRQAVFFDECHLDVKVVWHGYHIASAPVMARGAC